MPWSAADPPAGAPQRQRGVLSRRLAGALLLTILGIGHVLFGVTNFGFVERLPGDLAVIGEGAGAVITGTVCIWAGVSRARGGWPWLVVLAASGVFVVMMALSVITGFSDPPMLLVSLTVPVISSTALLLDRQRASIG